MKIQLEKASESYIVGVLLAVAGGFLDVYTYISRGGVFANAQTGNIVLLGISAADGNWKQIMSYVWPILAFMAGILLTEAVRKKYRYNPGLHWRQIVIGLEFLVLLCRGTAREAVAAWPYCACGQTQSWLPACQSKGLVANGFR